MVVLRADDEGEARRLVEADPYVVEGVSVDGHLREWNVVIGQA
jgi:uncharacterized protein YciI